MSTQAPERSYRIGDVAERVGVTTRTIRYYEELGLLGTASARTKGAHRLYSDADIARLVFNIGLGGGLGGGDAGGIDVTGPHAARDIHHQHHGGDPRRQADLGRGPRHGGGADRIQARLADRKLAAVAGEFPARL